MAENYAIEMRGITKTFGSVVANNGINLNVKSGEILALLGENGSGKTTLMNMLSGIYQPDSGSILVDGKEVTPPPRTPSGWASAGCTSILSWWMCSPPLTTSGWAWKSPASP